MDSIETKRLTFHFGLFGIVFLFGIFGLLLLGRRLLLLLLLADLGRFLIDLVLVHCRTLLDCVALVLLVTLAAAIGCVVCVVAQCTSQSGDDCRGDVNFSIVKNVASG